MTFALRPYQTAMIDEARRRLYRGGVDRLLLQLPTGGGKTALSGYMIGRAAERGFRSWFICHRRELIRQTAATFDMVGIPYGIVAAGQDRDHDAPALICSIDTLRRRIDRMDRPNVVVWDECHHTMATTWRVVMEAVPGAKHIGLSATPERLDGQGLGDLWQDMVRGPSVRWLIEQGFLADYVAYSGGAPDLTGVRSRGGDYAAGELEAAVDRPSIVGDVIGHYQRLARGKRAIAFCVSIQHSEHVVEQMRAAGIRAAHLDGTTPGDVRDATMAAFRAGDIEVISNVDLFGEGVDVPAIEAAILLRPTKSLSLYLQQVGRALRPAPGKKRAIILDHAGNVIEHGMPDEDRVWSLDGRPRQRRGAKEQEGPPVTTCKECFAAYRASLRACPECKTVRPFAGRQVEEVDGTLQQMDAKTLRRLRDEQARRLAADVTMNIQEPDALMRSLMRKAEKRGYRNPVGWAAHVWQSIRAKEEHAA